MGYWRTKGGAVYGQDLKWPVERPHPASGHYVQRGLLLRGDRGAEVNIHVLRHSNTEPS